VRILNHWFILPQIADWMIWWISSCLSIHISATCIYIYTYIWYLFIHTIAYVYVWCSSTCWWDFILEKMLIDP
jgi:hypothetical protein